MYKNIFTSRSFIDNITNIRNSAKMPSTFIGEIDIDNSVGPISWGQLVIVGGRPMQGKDCVIDRIITNAAKEYGVLMCSFTKSESYMADKLSSILKRTAGIENNIYTLCTSDITMQQMNKTLTHAVTEKGIKYIILDDIKYCFHEYGSTEFYRPIIAYSELRKFAMENNVIVISKYTTSWEADERSGADGKFPLLWDFQGVDEIADVIIGVHRPEYYNVMVDEYGNSLKNKIFINVLKAPFTKDFSINMEYNS